MKPDSLHSQPLHLTNCSLEWLMEEKVIVCATRDYWEKINAVHWNQVYFTAVIISTGSEKSFDSSDVYCHWGNLEQVVQTHKISHRATQY